MEDAHAQAQLQQAQAGDKAAFDALQEHLDPPVRRFVRRLIGVHPTEDDIMQDVFRALFVNLEQMYPAEKLLPFVYRVARNRCYDALRRQKRHQNVSLDDIAPLSAELYLQPEERAHWSLVFTRVKAAIDLLPEPQRQALILYAEEGFSMDEIGEIMSVSAGTVKSRLHHARLTLRRLLSADLYDTSGSKVKRKLLELLGEANDD